jgi:glycerol-3-phosphate dehydrogenase (NAD(P)+)
MYKIAVLGAGYMGSAITFPLCENGHQVNLWGTWLDDELIDSSLKGFHPKLKKALPEKVKLFYSDKLYDAVKDVDMVFLGITSDGFLTVFEKLLDCLDQIPMFFKLTKGLVNHNGIIKRATEAAFELLSKKFPGQEIKWTTIGGPVKAVELSDKIPTASVYAVSDSALYDIPFRFSTDYYPVTVSDDIIGVEISSAFKNVYAIGTGICDGMYQSEQEGMYHNFNAFVFTQAMAEISKIAETAGGKRETVFDLAGTGDFYVASLSGRNRRYGDYVGSGSEPEKIFEELRSRGEVAEGYLALKIAYQWVNDLKENFRDELPLLCTLYDIIFNGLDPSKGMQDFVLKMKNNYENH